MKNLLDKSKKLEGKTMIGFAKNMQLFNRWQGWKQKSKRHKKVHIKDSKYCLEATQLENKINQPQICKPNVDK